MKRKVCSFLLACLLVFSAVVIPANAMTDSQIRQQIPTDPEPTEPTPTDPAPTDPEPTEPTPTDPEPTDPEPTDPKPTEPAAHPADEYPDVNKNDWFYGAADYIIGTGYMGSTSQTEKTFEPMTKVSRAMVASILYRICGAPADVAYKGTFTDVPEGQWFTTAVEWCAQNGLASGKGDGTFDPNGNVTRQELAVFMYKLADYLEKDTTATTDLTPFPDGSTVPNWAAPYLKWAVGAGLITGKGQTDETTLLAPTDTAMRCELASILQRFLSQ